MLVVRTLMMMHDGAATLIIEPSGVVLIMNHLSGALGKCMRIPVPL